MRIDKLIKKNYSIEIDNEILTKKEEKDFLRWIRALKSGKYQQTKGTLQDREGYCCLGLACKLLIPKKLQYLDAKKFLRGRLVYDQPNAPKWLSVIDNDFYKKNKEDLPRLNDSLHFTFKDIANLLEITYLNNDSKTSRLLIKEGKDIPWK